MINFISSESINRLHNLISHKESATINTKLNRSYPKNQSICFLYYSMNPISQIRQFARNIIYIYLMLIQIEKTNNKLQLQSSISCYC